MDVELMELSEEGNSDSSKIVEDAENGNIAQRALNVLECPVCLDYMLPPIKQCTQGHSLCGVCRSQCNICPCCRSPFANIRNIALESLAEIIPLPCPNAIWGCTKLLKVEQRNDHKNKCYYRAIKCQDSTSQCSWTGTLEQYKEHCCLPSHFTFEPGTPLIISHHNTPYFSFTISAIDELFLFKQKFDEHANIIYWAVQFIGDGDKASDYVFEVSITSSLSSKKAKFKQACQSIYIDDKDLFNDDHAIPVNTVCITPLTRSPINDFDLDITIAYNDFILLAQLSDDWRK